LISAGASAAKACVAIVSPAASTAPVILSMKSSRSLRFSAAIYREGL
jgi:hypothetical protein